MRAENRFTTPTFLALVPLLFAMPGCGRDSTAPILPALPKGAVEVTITTTSTIGEIDITRYQVRIDLGQWVNVGVPTQVRIEGVTKANHRIELGGLAANCAVIGGNPRQIAVDPDLGTLLVSFSVSCTPESWNPWDY
ncbi:MAG TPA: hypothetical protein VJ840_13525 [Gemmatimonadaceae bacterium]|nr:hypothetical protein [Gemmatimonadaceae bacterium]